MTLSEPTLPPATGRGVPDRERLTTVVQSTAKRPLDIERRRGESLAVFAGFLAAYSLIGYWLVVRLHVVGFETLDRFNRGLMLFHDEPAKLSAVGFDYAPLSTLVAAAFSVVPALTSSLVVVPVVSAVFAALTMVLLNTMLRRAQVRLSLRLLVLVGLGLNPLVVMNASLGGRSFLWLSLVVAAVGALLAWYVTADIRFVMVAGLCFGLASLTGYTSLVFFVVAAVAVAAILARLGAGGREIEGTTIGFAAPAGYAVALWTLLCLVLLGRPTAWISDSSDIAASVGGRGDVALLDLVADTGRLLIDGAPLAIVVLPLLLAQGLVGRNTFALWLGALLGAAVLVPGSAALLGLTDAPMTMANALPILVLAVVGGIWLVRSTTRHAPAAVALGLALLVSVPWTFNAMPDFQHQGLERAFHDAVATRDSQEDARTVSGTVVGYDEEKAMGEWIRDHVTARDSVLTDNAQTYAVMLFSGRPDLFLDRVDRTDEGWARAAQNLPSVVDYLLLSTDPTFDLLSRRYPDAARGTAPGLREVFSTDRYRLVEVTGGPTSPTDIGPIDAAPPNPISSTRSAPHDDSSVSGSAR